ncbi:hypothetical protein Hanom_Chr12g01097871 [Helianthus anomalus]
MDLTRSDSTRYETLFVCFYLFYMTRPDPTRYEPIFYIARRLKSLKNFRTPRKKIMGPPLLITTLFKWVRHDINK